jgi:DNA-binding transcriptional MerR regulator
MTGLLIGDVAERTGVTPPTIRYYESIGLLTPAARSQAGYRRYAVTTVDELLFIRKAQTLGFSLDEIGEILKLTRAGKTPCSHVLSLAQEHLAAVDERIRQLQKFRGRLAAELAKWDGKRTPTCGGLCQIISDADADVRPVEFVSTPRARGRRVARR